MELKNIAILGPRGNVGSAIIKELLKDGDRFHITAITRTTSVYAAPPDTNITIKSVDYDILSSLTSAFEGQDAVVNCVTGGATQYEPMRRIIDAAIAAGVKLYFANEYVGNVTSEQFKRMPESFTGAKIRMREEMEKRGRMGEKEDGGLGGMKWTALNGGPFFDMWLMKGPAGIDVPGRRARIYGTGNNPLYWTPLPTIGLAAANMLRNPDPILNRPIYINSVPNLTQNVLLAAVESAIGQKFSVEHVDLEKINRNARIALERGEIGKAMKGLTVSNQFFEGDSGNDLSGLVENESVGVECVTVEDAVRQAVGIWDMKGPIVEGMFMVEACEI